MSTRAEAGWAVLKVSDTGRGIAPEWLERIFDMFVHGRPALERIGGGLGIGLALSRRIAELHAGSLRAHSEGVGKGSVFTLRIPLAESHKDAAKSPSLAAAAAEIAPKRVLIVDDNVDAAQTLELLLKSLGHETAVAHTGVEALRITPEFRPDIVLLDIGLPGLDGYEVARRLRTLKSEERVRIVAVTGWGQEADKQRSREAGFDLHLVKPISSSDLERALTQRSGATLH
jgi:CheY-like chemotaxis protein